MTCSSNGLPCRCTSGLGSSPDRAASRFPLPAARISASLVLDIMCLHNLVSARWFASWPVIEIANADIGGAEDPRVGGAGGRFRKPERATLAVLLDEVNAARPERGVLGRLTLNAGDRIVFRVHPYASAEQILVTALGNSIKYIDRSASHG